MFSARRGKEACQTGEEALGGVRCGFLRQASGDGKKMQRCRQAGVGKGSFKPLKIKAASSRCIPTYHETTKVNGAGSQIVTNHHALQQSDDRTTGS